MAYFIGSEVHYARRISPENISTLNDYFTRFGRPEHIFATERTGKSYYLVSGNGPALLLGALPSSPPGYIFNEEGRFVTWSRDPGDDPQFRQTWATESLKELEVEDVEGKFNL